MLKNGSFEKGWKDIVVGGVTRNQQPNDWLLDWLMPGSSLYNSTETAQAMPECVHKHRDDLPPNEHPGQPDALILDGVFVYKIFHGNQPFGAELRQVIPDLEPGTLAQVTVHVLVDAHGKPDPYGSEVGISLLGPEQWHSIGDLRDREWNALFAEAVVPASGILCLQLLFKSKWRLPVDFFIDAIKFDCTPAPVVPEPPPGPPPGGPIVITVIVPAGVEVEVERV